MIRLSKHLFYLCVTVAFVTACSNAPDQPSNFDDAPTTTETFLPNNAGGGVDSETINKPGDGSDIITGVEDKVDGGYIAEEGTPEGDKIIAENSSKPIIYGTGAAGIDFDTTFEESKQILAKPAYGPTSSGVAQYNEQIYIQWRSEGDEKDRTPIFILTFKGYQGKVQIQKPVGGVTEDIGMDADFSSYMGSDPRKGADQLAIDVYKAILGTDQDCIAERVCFVDWGDATGTDFQMVFPGMRLLASRDRFVVYRSLVFKTIPQGPLANHFDIFGKQFLFEGSDKLKLGETFETVDGVLTSEINTLKDVPVEVNTNTYGRGYEGIFLVYQRSDFDRKAIKPKNTDKLMAVSLSGQYRNVLMVDKAPLFIVESENNAVISDSPNTDLVGAKVSPLGIKVGLQRSNVKAFVKNLMDYLKVKAESKYAMVSAQFSGEYQLTPIKEYSAQIVGYDPKSKKGIYLSFGASEETGDMTSFFVMLLDDEFEKVDSVTMPVYASQMPVEKQMIDVPVVDFAGVPSGAISTQKDSRYTQLSGIKLNTLVKVTEQDFLGRGEATVELVEAQIEGKFVSSITSLLGGSERSGYSDTGELYTPNGDNVLIPRDQHFTNVGSFGVSLGLIPVGEQDGVLYGRVASITSGLLNGPIKDICGLEHFAPKIGMQSELFLSELQKFIKSENKECRYFTNKDDGSNSIVTSVYFPNDNLRVDFGDQELAQVMIWLPENEVESLPLKGGAQ